MKIALTGAAGMLGREIVHAASERDLSLLGWDREDFDLTDREATLRAIAAAAPDAVIHAAAWTDVDGCEADPKRAFRQNGRATGHVAEACREAGARLVMVSTDYVFSGDKTEPYLEDDAPGPISVYGWSKLVGEESVRSLGELGVIARTAWMYATHGTNFYRTMLRLAESHSELSVVDDQRGCPTYAGDVARTLLDLAASRASGLFHATNRGAVTWNGFAKAIFEGAQRTVTVHAVSSDKFPRPAPRPANSMLVDTRLEAAGIAPMPEWRAGLARCFEVAGLEEMGRSV